MFINTIKTALLLGSLSGLLMLLGGVIGGAGGIQMALVLSVVMNGVAYFFSDSIVLKMYGAQKLNTTTYGWIHDMVRELSGTMNMPMPKLYLVNTPMANAFATGRNPSNGAIAVTTGILDILNKKELRGVLAHELSHIKNRDILVSTIAATLATAIGYVAHMLQYAAFWGSMSGNRKDRGNPIVMLIIAILMPIAATIIQLAISRSREYLADETGAHNCQDPNALADALEKLHTNIPNAHLRNDDVQRASTAPLFIVHPFSGNNLVSLFATHPPMHKRIALLRAMHKKMFS